MNNIDNILDHIKGYRNLGERKLENGTLLIGKAPHIAPQAWLHSIYPSLAEEQIKELENRMQVEIPIDYKIFLKMCNGLNVFNTTFNLYGYRGSHSRNIEDAWQPFDLIKPNTIERPADASKNVFIIGGYDWDGSRLYIDKNTNRTHFCKRDKAVSLYEWNSFEDMLESEIKRLIKLFDQNGKQLNEEESTLPV